MERSDLPTTNMTGPDIIIAHLHTCENAIWNIGNENIDLDHN